MSLFKIQSELKAPKGQFNKFGKYNYRSSEDIIEAVKPVLAKYNYSLTTSQEVISVGGRVYIQTDARLINEEGKVIANATAQAREEDNKKGMDAAQLSGSTGSYSKKYALNNLFAIDDTKDSDTLPPPEKKPVVKKITIKDFIDEVDKFAVDSATLAEWRKKNGRKILGNLNETDQGKLKKQLELMAQRYSNPTK